MEHLAGFWSYVHDDNTNDGGRILRLAERLSEEFELQTGDPLRLFVDRDGIEWGQEWEKRIAEALQETTFLIPVITPSFFRHPECRKELLRFTGEATSLGLGELLLPIYYSSVPELDREEEPTDEVMRLVRGTQWVDVREARLLDENDTRHRTLVYGLAQRIASIAIRTEDAEAVPSSQPVGVQGLSAVTEATDLGTAPGDDGSEAASSDDEEAGLLDVLAAGEAALPEWAATMEALGVEMERMTELTAQSTQELDSADSFAARLAAASRLAKNLDDVAENIERLGQDYVSHLVSVDPSVRTLLRLVEEPENREAEGTEGFLTGLEALIAGSKEGIAGALELSEVLEENAGFSRELRRPLRKINAALRNIADGQSIIEDWEKGLRDLREKD